MRRPPPNEDAQELDAVLRRRRQLGFASERLDHDGEGPDNAWRTDDERIFVLSCKNEKKPTSLLHKKDLSQLYIDAKWIEEHHPQLKQVLVMVHPSSEADEGLLTNGVYVLTTTGLGALVAAVRQMAEVISRADLTLSELEVEAGRLLKQSDLKVGRTDKCHDWTMEPGRRHERPRSAGKAFCMTGKTSGTNSFWPQ